MWFNHEGYQIKVEREVLPKRGGDRVMNGSDPPTPPPKDSAGHGGARPSGSAPPKGDAPGNEP